MPEDITPILFIGTDATHSEHIETIKTRRYVGVQSDGSFVPGELGIGLVEGPWYISSTYINDTFFIGYDSMGYQLSKPKLRAELEADLKRCFNTCFHFSLLFDYYCSSRICEGQQTKDGKWYNLMILFVCSFLSCYYRDTGQI